MSQMSILLHKPYLVKWSTKGEGVKNFQKMSTWFMNDPKPELVTEYHDREHSESSSFLNQPKFQFTLHS